MQVKAKMLINYNFMIIIHFDWGIGYKNQNKHYLKMNKKDVMEKRTKKYTLKENIIKKRAKKYTLMGLNSSEVSKILGISNRTVQAYACAGKWKNEIIRNELTLQIVAMWLKGKTYKEIANDFDYSISNVYKILSKNPMFQYYKILDKETKKTLLNSVNSHKQTERSP